MHLWNVPNWTAMTDAPLSCLHLGNEIQSASIRTKMWAGGGLGWWVGGWGGWDGGVVIDSSIYLNSLLYDSATMQKMLEQDACMNLLWLKNVHNTKYLWWTMNITERDCSLPRWKNFTENTDSGIYWRYEQYETVQDIQCWINLNTVITM